MSVAGRTAAAAMTGGAAAEFVAGARRRQVRERPAAAAFARLFGNEGEEAKIKREIHGLY